MRPEMGNETRGTVPQKEVTIEIKDVEQEIERVA